MFPYPLCCPLPVDEYPSSSCALEASCQGETVKPADYEIAMPEDSPPDIEHFGTSGLGVSRSLRVGSQAMDNADCSLDQRHSL